MPVLLERTQIRMMRWMMGIKRIEKITMVEIRASAVVANKSQRIREARPRWLAQAEIKTALERCSNWMKVSRP